MLCGFSKCHGVYTYSLQLHLILIVSFFVSLLQLSKIFEIYLLILKYILILSSSTADVHHA